MPYICDCFELKLANGRIAKKGDLVPEADGWAENIRRSNLRMGYIKEVKPAGKHPGAVAISVPPPPLSHEQVARQISAPLWLMNETQKEGRVIQLKPESMQSAPADAGGGVVEPNQGPAASAAVSEALEDPPSPRPEQRKKRGK